MKEVVCLGGAWVAAEDAGVSVFDRGLLYGDGLFETIWVHAGVPFRWQAHLRRMRAGAGRMGLRVPFEESGWYDLARELIRKNELDYGFLRLTLTRGVGTRGYSARGANSPSWFMTSHVADVAITRELKEWRLGLCPYRVFGDDGLTEVKSTSRLLQVMARTWAEEEGHDDALVLNQHGEVAEASGANVFLLTGFRVITPPLGAGALGGITREVVRELAGGCGLALEERRIRLEDAYDCGAVFLSVTGYGLVEIVAIDRRPVRRCATVRRLWEAYWRLVSGETSMAIMKEPEGGLR